jgi:asparagine synthase (glutamine-hydrolysing)
MIQEWIETKSVDETKIYEYLPPISRESRWYRDVFEKEFNKDVVIVVPYFWMPRWTNTNDPSARTLNVYNELNE